MFYWLQHLVFGCLVGAAMNTLFYTKQKGKKKMYRYLKRYNLMKSQTLMTRKCTHYNLPQSTSNIYYFLCCVTGKWQFKYYKYWQTVFRMNSLLLNKSLPNLSGKKKDTQRPHGLWTGALWYVQTCLHCQAHCITRHSYKPEVGL